ncbi:MAG: 23S rRNA (pseudouridine(1915)-N(3))-methyltransferase RlmH [Leptolyngbya sp. DLM2.Bin15]|nr:MAG: 23S rRNA (pseudouridine(1915)-N(3))-methyltransferase RlmH [Leptolyngbya sp. DLM2.Bin15]
MRPRIIAVGKVKKGWIQQGIQEYWKRLPELSITEIKDSTPAKEAQKVRSLLQSQDRVIVLSEWGKGYTSVEFADFIRQAGATPLAFIIGGPDGFGEEMRSQADHLISLSPMTFTHEMARLFLVEQLYRAKAILNNTGYHK